MATLDLRAAVSTKKPGSLRGEGVLQFSCSHPDYRVRVPETVVLAAAKAIAQRRNRLDPK